MLAILTGHTCGEACWHAKEEVCKCSCGGANHGILNKGGSMPERVSKKYGQIYNLVGIAQSYSKASDMVENYLFEHFTGLDNCAYGSYRDCSHMPVLALKASASQLKWIEVKNVRPDERQDIYLIWALPAGSKYITKRSKDAFYSPTKQFIPPVYARST